MRFAANGVFLQNSKADDANPYDINCFAIQPKLFFEFDLSAARRLHPQIGLGYSFLIFNGKNDNSNPDIPEPEYQSTESGFNASAGVRYDVTESLFLQIDYNFIKIGVGDEVPDTSFNSTISLIKFGVGYQI